MNFSSFKKRDRVKKELRRQKLALKKDKRFIKKKINPVKCDFFDLVRVKKIETMVSKNPQLSIEYIENYLIDYPKDYYVKALYVSALITLKQFKLAHGLLIQLDEEFYGDEFFLNSVERFDKIKNSILYTKLKYYLYSNQLKNANKLILCNPDLMQYYSLEIVLFYIRVKLNYSDAMDYYKNTYMFNQILNYSERAMREHIERHLAPMNMNRIYRNDNIFACDFPIDEILLEIKQYLTEDNAVYSGLTDDIYYFKYDNCGRDRGKLTNYFKVMCIHGTKNIITLCPTLSFIGDNIVDLNYFKNDLEGKAKQYCIRGIHCKQD